MTGKRRRQIAAENKFMKKSLPAAVNIIMSVFIAISLVIGSFCSLFSYIYTHPEAVVKRCLTEQTYSSVISAARDAVSVATTSLVSADRELLLQSLDNEQLRKMTEEYVTAGVNALLKNGGAPQTADYESEVLKSLVFTAISDSAAASELNISDARLAEDSEQAYELLCEYIGSAASFMPDIIVKLFVKIGAFLARFDTLIRLAPVTLLAFAAFTVLKVLCNLGRASAARIVYGVASPIWLGSVAIMSPFIVLLTYDIPSKIVISSGSALYYFASGLINSIIIGGLFFGIVIFLAATAMLVPSVLNFTRHQYRKERWIHHERREAAKSRAKNESAAAGTSIQSPVNPGDSSAANGSTEFTLSGDGDGEGKPSNTDAGGEAPRPDTDAGGEAPRPDTDAGGEAPRPDTDAGSARGQIRI